MRESRHSTKSHKKQLGEIAAGGFQLESQRVVTMTILGSMSIEQRKGFVRFLDKMERGDVQVVTKLDRLGRDAVERGYPDHQGHADATRRGVDLVTQRYDLLHKHIEGPGDHAQPR